jgi:hypothetical protein
MAIDDCENVTLSKSHLDVLETLCNSTVSMLEVSDYVGSDNTDTFHVPRPERDIELDSVESDIPDDTVVEVPSTSEVTYQVIEKGTERGKRKLVTSDGYS